MRRCFVFFLPAMFIGAVANAQLVNNGATITVQSGATIKCTGAIINNSGGIIQNAGIVSSDGDLRNEVGGTLTNNGTTGVYEATTKFVNYGNAFSALKLRLIGNVNTDSIKSGAGSTYDSVILAKGAGTSATLSDAMTVNVAVAFNNDNNKLSIEDETLTMGSSAIFQNPDNNQFVITNSTGTVTKQSLGASAFVYPVGFSAAEFNPLTISNSGTADNISVRCLQNVLANGTTGSTLTTDFASNSWVVTEGTPGGSNLTLTGEWAAGDELSNFNRVKSGIARYNTGTDWDLPASNVIAASGSGPYNRSRSNISTTGVFAVADLDKVNAAKLNLKVFLQGPYSSITGLMHDSLRVRNVIPTTQPYSAALDPKFTRVGVYDGTSTVNETVNPTVFTVTGNDAIVDWVYVSTLDPATPSTKLQTRAALLQRDGDIVDVDGVSPLNVPIDADGNYHVLVSHRNHLSIRTSSALSLTDNVTLPYSFITAQAQAYQNPAYTANNNAMFQNGSAFLMWAGNANLDSAVRVTTQAIPSIQGDGVYILGTILAGVPNATVLGYSAGDINMDGKVRATTQALPSIPGDIPYILGTPLGGSPNGIRREHK